MPEPNAFASGMKGKDGFDFYLALVLILCVAFVSYWMAYANWRYTDFISVFFDLGIEAQSMFIHLNHANLVYGLQFLSFSNHISPFKLLLLPIFALIYTLNCAMK